MAELQRFHKITIIVAVIVLLIVLILVGILMAYGNKSNTNFPPLANSCPDYWLSDISGNCIIPASGTGKNSGTGIITSTNTPGYDNIANTIDFKNSMWGGGKSGSICNKRKWCNLMGILWDGIDNYNGCTSASTSPTPTTSA
jgi:hypothetical protein